MRLFLLFFMVINISCFGQKSELVTTKYFQSWGGYSIPKKPQKEIDTDNLKEYSTYYKAIYKDGLLIRFEKYHNGNSIGYDKYQYWEDTKTLKEHVLVNEDNEKRIHQYDKSGKKIEH